MNVKKVKPNTIFIYNGVGYMWKTNNNGNWERLYYEDGEVVEPSKIPFEILSGQADVEIKGEENV